MKFTKEEALKACKLFLAKIINGNYDDLMDDGSNIEDAAQNEAFSRALFSVEDAHSFFAHMDIDVVSDTEMSNIWRNSWITRKTDNNGEEKEYMMSPSLPESRYNHNVRFALAIINKLSEQ